MAMKWIVLTVVALTLTSCSYLTKFYFYNDTDTAVEITYTIKRIEKNRPFVSVPKVYAFKRPTKVSNTPLENSIPVSKDSLLVTYKLLPNQALWIGTDVNFSLKSEFDVEKIKQNLAFVSVTSEVSEKQYTPDSILTYFETYTHEYVGIELSKLVK